MWAQRKVGHLAFFCLVLLLLAMKATNCLEFALMDLLSSNVLSSGLGLVLEGTGPEESQEHPTVKNEQLTATEEC